MMPTGMYEARYLEALRALRLARRERIRKSYVKPVAVIVATKSTRLPPRRLASKTGRR